MNAHWSGFLDELSRWRDAGRTVEFWWRDDDACQVGAALQRLVTLADVARVPLALAVIPSGVQAALLVPASAQVTLLQHGVDHCNRATGSDKKTEFALAEPVPDAIARLVGARAWLTGPHTLAVLVPPWNRISSPGLLDALAAAGYCGLSRYGARDAARPVQGLVQVNTHVDIIDWRGGGGFVGTDAALALALRHLQARRLGVADAGEATGWLTHHRVHDAQCWDFLASLFERTAERPEVLWRSANALFAPPVH